MNFIKNLFNNKNITEYTKNYGDIQQNLEYQKCMMYECLQEISIKHPHNSAIEYYGKNLSYKRLYEKIEICAKALKKIGVAEKERVTICMPNTPEAIIMVYAVNMIGATASMIHPLSSENEIEFYMDAANSKYILTLSLFAEKVITAAERVNAKKVIIAEASDGMFKVMQKALSIYTFINNYIKKEETYEIKYNETIIKYSDFFEMGYSFRGNYKVTGKYQEEAIILYSGGTTGKPKGVQLSNNNFNVLAKQCFNMTGAKVGESVLTIMPIFHGFGLGVSVHTLLSNGMRCVLIPSFKVSEFAKLIKRYRPVFLAGVPTMYEALISTKDNSKYLKCVKNVICGGDLLKEDLNNRVNDYLAAHGSDAQIRVGYGLTESTAACILTPNYYFKENAIGIPLPDMAVKIVKPGTTKEVKAKHEGEICISGPTVMLGYLNEPEETKNTLIKHEDGKIWLHTGDVGYVDKNGVVFFTSRLKRVIVSSGYNVYPTYLEKIIVAHPSVKECVVVGIPHPYKKQVPVACIVLKEDFNASDELTNDIKKYCEKSIAKYSMPYRYEYIKSVPKTLIGKINFKKLEEECTKKYYRG